MLIVMVPRTILIVTPSDIEEVVAFLKIRLQQVRNWDLIMVARKRNSGPIQVK